MSTDRIAPLIGPLDPGDKEPLPVRSSAPPPAWLLAESAWIWTLPPSAQQAGRPKRVILCNAGGQRNGIVVALGDRTGCMDCHSSLAPPFPVLSGVEPITETDPVLSDSYLPLIGTDYECYTTPVPEGFAGPTGQHVIEHNRVIGNVFVNNGSKADAGGEWKGLEADIGSGQRVPRQPTALRTMAT